MVELFEWIFLSDREMICESVSQSASQITEKIMKCLNNDTADTLYSLLSVSVNRTTLTLLHTIHYLNNSDISRRQNTKYIFALLFK